LLERASLILKIETCNPKNNEGIKCENDTQKLNKFNKEVYFSWFVAKMDVDFNSILTAKPGGEE
jgi:hypothetical protein